MKQNIDYELDDEKYALYDDDESADKAIKAINKRI